jgi:glucose/arabinose dehydrogenase
MNIAAFSHPRPALLKGLLVSLTLTGLIGSAAAAPRAVTVAEGLEHPWGLAFLPDGRMLVTERPGHLRIVTPDGRISAPVAGLPAVDAGGQGGLLDVALDPHYADNGLVYWSYSEPGQGLEAGRNGTAVARGKLVITTGNPGTTSPARLEQVQVIFLQQPKVNSKAHFGSRLVFAPDGRLFVTLGERFSRKDDAQTLDNHLGKIVRIEADGSVPADNPLVGQPGALPEIWSWGHRNVQGAAINPADGTLWATEHGPQGGDELNHVQRGRNHGWPVITYGRNYGTGTRIGEGTERADVVAPVRYWVPVSIAPSGLAFLSSERYPGWQGSLFLGALRGEVLWRLTLEGDKVKSEQRLLDGLNERIRDVRQGPDGWIYLLTDSPRGRVLRLLP